MVRTMDYQLMRRCTFKRWRYRCSRGGGVSEADPETMSVGYGGLPDRDGHVTLDACIMDHTGNCGSVSFLQHIKHPISVARKVMDDTPHVMLSGAGALKFALDNGFPKEDLLTDKARKRWEEWLIDSQYKPIINVENHDTIGLLALDQNGDISGACTTSGLSYKNARSCRRLTYYWCRYVCR